MEEDVALFGGYAVAGLGPFAVVTLLSVARDEPFTAVITIFVLSVVIAAAAALAGPKLGLVATLMSALWFDFLLIEPYGILKVNRDVWPVAVLVVVGLLVAAAASAKHRITTHDGRADATSSAVTPSRHIHRILRLIEDGIDQRDLVSAVEAELTILLSARGCRFEEVADAHADDSTSRPRLERDGTFAGAGDPEVDDVELPVQLGSRRVGRFLVTPTPGMSIPFDHRLVAVMLTDHVAAAIGARHTSSPPLT